LGICLLVYLFTGLFVYRSLSVEIPSENKSILPALLAGQQWHTMEKIGMKRQEWA